MQISLSGCKRHRWWTNDACDSVTWSEAHIPVSCGRDGQEVLDRPRPSLASRWQDQCVAPSDIPGLCH